MTYLSYTWGGNDNPTGSYGPYDIYCNDGYYPAARAATSPTIVASPAANYIPATAPTPTYPVWITYVGANVASSGGAMKGTIKVGTVTSATVTPPVNTSYANASMVWGATGGDLVYSASTRVTKQLYWNNTTTWGGWAGRSTSTAYTTVFTGSATPNKDGQMGGGVRYYLAPTEPLSVTATATSGGSGTVPGQIDITWTVPLEDGGSGTTRTSSSEINAYSIYRSTTSLGQYDLVAKISSSTALSNYGSSQYLNGKYSDTSTKSGNTTYFYKVVAHNLVTDAVASTTFGAISAASNYAYAPQVPTKPTITATASSTNAGTVVLSYSSSVQTGSPAISSYDIYRDSVKINSSTVTSTTYTDSTGTAGTSYSYTVIAKNSIGSSISSDASTALAPGAPASPSSASISKTGRNVEVTSSASTDNYGKSITGYYVQYQYSSTSDGTYSSWSTPVAMTSSGDNFVYTYELLSPAKWYKFRVYAKNSIINNSSGTRTYYPDNNTAYTANFYIYDTATFIAAGGKRLRGQTESDPGTFQPASIVKRFGITSAQGVTPVTYGWIDATIAKKYDPTNPNAVNGWVDLS